MACRRRRCIPRRKTRHCFSLVFVIIAANQVCSLLFQHTSCVGKPGIHNPTTKPNSKGSFGAVGADVSDSLTRLESLPKNEETLDQNKDTSTFQQLMKLASMHCASQALNTAVQLKIPYLLDDQTQMSVEELAEAIEASSEEARTEKSRCNRDALLRTMRLLTTIGIVREKTPAEAGSSASSFGFSLTPLGMCLRTSPSEDQPPSMASCIQHWMEQPLWDSWLELPSYIVHSEENSNPALPFEKANGGVSSDVWYNERDHPESLNTANEFVQLIHHREVEAVVGNFDWSVYRHQRLVDVAGNNGKVAEAIASSEPSLHCSCLDLPEVIASASQNGHPKTVTLVPGNVFDPETIPDCEIILMKHFCDRCMWDDDQTVEILRSCHTVLQRSSERNATTTNVPRRIVIADAVLPDCGAVNDTNELPLYLDALYMLVGRERQRTKSEWASLAEASGLRLETVIYTDVPSCSLIVLEPM